MHEHGRALFNVGMPKCLIGRVTRAVEYVEGGEGVYGSRCSRFEGRARRRGLEERMDARMLGGPSSIAEDAAGHVAREEARSERRTEGFPGQGTLVLCEAAEGVIPCSTGIGDGLWGETRGPPKAIGRSGKARALDLLVEGTRMTIDERMVGGVGETVWGRGTMVGTEKLHGWVLMKGGSARWVADVVAREVAGAVKADFRGRV